MHASWHDGAVIEVVRVAVGDEGRATSILVEAATWLADSGRAQWSISGLAESVAAAVAEGEAYVAMLDGDDVASWFLNAQDTFWWPELGSSHDSLFFHKFAIRRRVAGTGVARAALDWAINETRDVGCRWLRLDCMDRPPMRKFYEAAGFVLHDTVAIPELGDDACRYVLDVTGAGRPTP
jgi:GNAT superfamily N-acetyltransferase